MADVTVDSLVSTNAQRQMRSAVFVSSLVGYFFYIDSDADFYYTKTTNGGATWGTPVAVSGAETIVASDVWYDQWTPGNKGRTIHIWYFGTTADDPTYRSLNTTNDVLSGATSIVTTTSAAAGRGAFISGARMRGGNLLCCYDIDAGAEHGTYRSVNNGVTWTARTDLVEATIDQAFVFPGNAADPQDGWFLYQDASTDELTLKVHDDSANTNSESSALTLAENVTDGTGQYGFSGAIRHSDGHLIVAYMDAYDSAGASDFKVYDINGSGSLTALTDIATNLDDFYYPSVFIDQRNDVIYVAYIGKSDGSESLGTSVNVYYAKSADRGVTWTKDVAYSQTAAAFWQQTWAPLSGPMFMIFWINATSGALLSNFVNKKEFGFVTLNNYQFVSSGDGMSVTEKIR